MKELRKIKLINWHYFTNEELDIKGSTLITGDNASGKSTIIDAIQYVLVADLRQIKFNSSAHDETKRDLLGYLRCKTGSDCEDGQRFLRRGDITSYVALEFYDHKQRESFILGAVIDSYGDDLTYKAKFFKIERCSIEDGLFIDGNRPRNIKEFRRHLKTYQANLYSSVEQYKDDLLVKFGAISERFFDLFVKAISFKPITDIREFVYSYVLDEKPINIETMKENFERYREYTQLVQETIEKLECLEKIKEQFADVQYEKERAITHDYLITRARVEKVAAGFKATKGELEKAGMELDTVQEKISLLADREKESQERLLDYKVSLQNNSVYQIIRELEREIKELERRRDELQSSLQYLKQQIAEEGTKLANLLQVIGVWEEVHREAALAVEKSDDVSHQDRARDMITSDSLLTPSERDQLQVFCKKLEQGLEQLTADEIDRVKAILNEFNQAVRQISWHNRNRQKQLQNEIEKLQSDLKNLKQNRMVYDRKVTDLQKIITEKFREEKDINVKPEILCELLEIPDEKWQDAVEGYLNTRRFDLILEPRYFDYALSVYEKYKRKYNIYGVGLVNTGKVMQYLDRIKPGSLAEEVVADNKYARGYVNQLLGTLIKCESEQELKKYRRAITPTCMTYINNTARQINFAVYETPYIGKRAIKRQIARKEAALKERKKLLANLEEEARIINTFDSLSGGKDELYFLMKKGITDLQELDNIQQKLKEKETELSELDTSDIRELQEEISRLEAEIDRIKEEKDGLVDRRGQLKNKCSILQARLTELEFERERVEEEFNYLVSQYPERQAELDARYRKELKNKGSEDKLIADFVRSRKGIDTLIARKEVELRELQIEYNNRFQFGGLVSADSIQEYEDEYRKLKESELPEYEEKIEIARKEAEEEFKEHFVYKLKENIENARNEFNYLNDALQGIKFGSDSYRFKVTAAEHRKKFYDLIMDPYLFKGSLFDQAFQDKHREAMDELFEKILYESSEYLGANLEEYTDYRTFLNYDIIITHGSGETSSFSRICREQSGGETQTPYYVAIVASFMQLYRVKSNDRSPRLMVFDEAFNRMDSDRIEKTLKFMRKLGMQFIIAAPTEKCEYITPHVPTTLLIFRSGHRSWIEDYKQLQLDDVV